MDIIPKPEPGRMNPYKAYGQAVTGHRRLGTMTKYDKGVWFAGTGATALPIEPGTELVAVITALLIGWVKFVNGDFVDSDMGYLSEGFVMPKRTELDDLNEDDWEVRPDGTKKDPWSRSNELPLISPGDDAIYTCCTGSKGGLAAIGELCLEYNEELPLYPLVALGTDSYMHKVKSLGRIHVPTLKIVKYVDSAPYDDIIAKARGDGPGPVVSAPKPIANNGGAIIDDDDDEGHGSVRGGLGGEIDDDIPF